MTSYVKKGCSNIPDSALDNCRPLLEQPFFTYEVMKTKSSAAANMANWVINIVAYNTIYKKVAPLIERVRVATETKETAEAALAVVLARVAEVQAQVAKLNAEERCRRGEGAR